MSSWIQCVELVLLFSQPMLFFYWSNVKGTCTLLRARFTTLLYCNVQSSEIISLILYFWNCPLSTRNYLLIYYQWIIQDHLSALYRHREPYWSWMSTNFSRFMVKTREAGYFTNWCEAMWREMAFYFINLLLITTSSHLLSSSPCSSNKHLSLSC